MFPIAAKILSLGINGVLAIKFTKSDADSNAKKFINYLVRHIDIHELWLGATQSFGRWKEGSFEAINNISRQHGIRLKLLRKFKQTDNREILQRIKKGLQPFSKIQLPQLPTWKRSKKKYITLNWCKGKYKVALSNSIDFNKQECRIFHVEAVPLENKLVRIFWPDNSYKWLFFLRGP